MKAMSVPARKARWRQAGALVLGAAVIAVTGSTVGYLANRRITAGPVVRATLTFPPNITVVTLGDQAGAPVLSPDGNNLVFAGISEAKQLLFVRAMDSGAVKKQSNCSLYVRWIAAR